MKKGILIYLLFLSTALQAQLSDFGKVDFHRADSIADLYKGESLKNLPLLSHILTTSLPTKLEQFRAIYTWISKNIENDHGAYQKNKRNREKHKNSKAALEAWNSEFQAKVFQKLLKEQKTVCTGYAYLVRELANFAGINCKIIDGYGRTADVNVNELSIPNHSWNAVELDGKWYLSDATWSSGITLIPDYTYKHEYNDGYFLAEPELFVKSHYPLETDWILMESEPTIEAFLNGPIVYRNAFKENIIPISPTELEIEVVKNVPFIFTLKAPTNINFDDIALELTWGKSNQPLKPEITQDKEGFLEFEHKFSSTGQYDLHIKYGEGYVATYTIRVKKR